MSKADKLPLDMEPVVHDDNTIFKLKAGDQSFIAPYSMDNCSNANPELKVNRGINFWCVMFLSCYVMYRPYAKMAAFKLFFCLYSK